jgi:L-fuconate dehydratase
MGAFWRTLTNDSQFRWLGPEKGTRAQHRHVDVISTGKAKNDIKQQKKVPRSRQKILIRPGVIHLATGALVNAVWDLWARVEGKPLWRLICDLPSEEIVRCIDFRYLTDVLTPEEGALSDKCLCD